MGATAATPLVLNAADVTTAPAAWIGGKAFHLAQLGTSTDTLPGFVVTTAAWQLMLGEDQTRLLSDTAAMVQEHLTNHPVPDRPCPRTDRCRDGSSAAGGTAGRDTISRGEIVA